MLQANTKTNAFAALLTCFAFLGCTDSLPDPKVAQEVSQTADNICAASVLLPASPEKEHLAELCATQADVKELAAAYAQAPR